MHFLVLLLGFAAVLALLLLPLPIDAASGPYPALLSRLENFVHAPLFAGAATLTFRVVRQRFQRPSSLPYLLALLGCLVLALATEALQQLVGRDAAWIDVLSDAAGTGVALLLHLRAEQRRTGTAMGLRIVLPLAIAVLAAIIATPLLLTIGAYGYRAAHAPLLWRADAPLLWIFAQQNTGRYPGLELKEPFPDWRSFSRLVVELHSGHGELLPVTVRVEDRHHSRGFEDRFNRTFDLTAGWHVLRIPLSDVRDAPRARSMDMRQIGRVIVFQVGDGPTADFIVRSIWLER